MEWEIRDENGRTQVLTVTPNDSGNYELTPEALTAILLKSGFVRIS